MEFATSQMDVLKARLETLNFSEAAARVNLNVDETFALAKGWAAQTTLMIKDSLRQRELVAAMLIVVFSVFIQTAFLSPKPVRKARGTRPSGYWYLAWAMAVSKFMLVTFLAHIPTVEGFDVTRAISMFIPVFVFSGLSVLILHGLWLGAKAIKLHDIPTSFCRDGFEWFSNTYTCAMWTTLFQSLYSSSLFSSESSSLRGLPFWPVLDATADTFTTSMHRFRTMFLVTNASMFLLCITEFAWVRLFRWYFSSYDPRFRFISSGIPYAARKRSGDTRPSVVLAQESVTWYSIYITSTALDVLLSALEFLGRSRAREIQGVRPIVPTYSKSETLSKLGVFDFSHDDSSSSESETDSESSSQPQHETDSNRKQDMKGLPLDVEAHIVEEDQDGFWFDWVADVGDGFNATYAVAAQLAQPHLDVFRPPDHWEVPSTLKTVSDPQYSLKKHKRVGLKTSKNSGPSTRNRSLTPIRRPSTDKASKVTKENTTQLRRRSRRNQTEKESSTSPVKVVPSSSKRTEKKNHKEVPKTEETTDDEFDWQSIRLPRGKLLVIGGDLAYPNPTEENFESRLFYPYECALPPSRSFNAATSSRRRAAVLKDQKSIAGANLAKTPSPICLAIPGNHDWLDGCNQFDLKIIHNDHLGGWELPQTQGFFATKLPHNWWILGIDNGLTRDMNVSQLEYFIKVSSQIPEDGNVILVTHEPDFVLNEWKRLDIGGGKRNIAQDGIGGDSIAPDAQLTYQLQQILGKKLRMRLSGDLHHYSRYSNEAGKSHWVVAGGGGAFMHPTHVFPEEIPSALTNRMFNVTSFPNRNTSRNMAWWNITQFRRNNWLFDCLGALVYFALIYSVFESHIICNSFNSIVTASSITHFLKEFVKHVIQIQLEIVSHGATLSSFAAFFLFVISCNFSGGIKLQTVLHFYLHWFSSVGILVTMRLTLFLARMSGIVAQQGEIYAKLTTELEPSIERCNQGFVTHFGVEPGVNICKQTLSMMLSFVEWPERIWELGQSCTTRVNGHSSTNLSSGSGVVFHTTFFAIYWMLASIMVSFLFSMYLALYGYFGKHHFDEPYSSLRWEGYKNFLRFHISNEGTLSMYAIGMETVPTSWLQDSEWTGRVIKKWKSKARSEQHVSDRSKVKVPPSYLWKNPSKFAASPSTASDAPCLIDFIQIPARKSS